MKEGTAYGVRLGPFLLDDVIGRGGSCDVWCGVHWDSQHPVAIKVMHQKEARNLRYARAFRDEVRAVAALHHPSIVQLFDFGLITEEAARQSRRSFIAGSHSIF